MKDEEVKVEEIEVGTVHQRNSIYCNTGTRNAIPFTAKRDSENFVDCKTRTCYAISCFMYY